MSVAAYETVQSDTVAQDTQPSPDTPNNPSLSTSTSQNTLNSEQPTLTTHHGRQNTYAKKNITPHRSGAPRRRHGQCQSPAEIDKALFDALERGRQKEELRDKERKDDSEYHFCMHVYAELRRRNNDSKKAIKRKISKTLEEHG